MHSPSGTQRCPRRMYPDPHAQEATPLDSWHTLLEGHWREAQLSTAETWRGRWDGMGWDGMGWDGMGWGEFVQFRSERDFLRGCTAIDTSAW